MPLPTPSPTDQVGWRFNALGALFVTVKALEMVAAGYWIGSSNSSQNKDATIAAIAAPPAAPPEPPVGGFIPARPAP
jgi:hypothetical protein